MKVTGYGKREGSTGFNGDGKSEGSTKANGDGEQIEVRRSTP
jgi:hypothetical protein